MATYIKGLTDVVPEIKPFQPNLNLVQQALSTLQNRYDQGFASVKSVYNQILNAPISNMNNQAVRDGFLKEAETKLKNLASVDLSIPENQAAAEQVFAPFWEDNLILQDQGLTKALKSEIAKGERFRSSTDEKVRAQYSETAMKYLTNELGRLQRADRDPNSFGKLQKRRFVPFQDVQVYLDNRAKEMGLEIKWEAENGPELRKITGGAGSVKSFRSFAHNALGDQFTDQFNVEAAVDLDTRIQRLQMLDPTMTDEQARKELGRGVMKEQREVLTDQKTYLSGELKQIQDKLAPYLEMTDFDEKQEVAYKQLRAEEAQVNEAVKAAEQKVLDFDKQIQKDPDSFMVGLESYYANVIKARTISRWANARAAKQDVETKLNPIWDAQRKVEKDKRDYELKLRATIAAEQRVLFEKYKWDHPQKKTKSKSGGGGGSEGGDEEDVDITDPEQTGRIEGVDVAHAPKRGSDEEVFEHEQAEKWNGAHQLLFSDEVGGRLLEKLGVPTADRVQYLSAMKALTSHPTDDLSDKDKGLLFNLSQVLHNKNTDKDLVEIDLDGGKITKTVEGFSTKDFYGVRKDLLDTLGAELGKLYQEDGPEFDPKDLRMLLAYMMSSRELEQYNSLEAARTKAIDDFFVKNAGDKKYKNYVKQVGNQKQVVNEEDLTPYFQTTVFEALDVPDDENGQRPKITLTPKELAIAYMNGDLAKSGQYGLHAVKIRGKEYKMVQYGPVTVEEQLKQVKEGKMKDYDVEYPASGFNYAMLQLDKLYESSEEFKKRMDKVRKDVIGKLPQFKNRTGVQGYTISWEFHHAKDKNPDNDVATQLLKDARNPANFEGIYIGEEMLHKDDPQYMKVLKALNQGELDLEKTFTIVRMNMKGINGRPSLEVQFKQATKKAPDDAEDNTDYVGDMGGKTIEIDLNPNPTGPMLKRIRNNPDNYVYGSIMEGKVFKSDPILEKAHVGFEIIPNHPEHPTEATLEMHIMEYTKDGTYEPVKVEPVKYSLANITPDQLVNEAYVRVARQHQKNLKLRELYKEQKVVAKATKTRAEIDKEMASAQ